MKAAVHTKYGSPDVLTIQDVARPVPKPNEILIRVHATTVNRTDCQYLRGKPRPARLIYGLPRPKNHVLGNEFAGQIVETGSAVTTWQVGDDVFGYDDSTFGGHAQFKTMPETGMIARMSAGMPYDQAAPTAEGAHYAMPSLRKANVGSGTRVMVNGGTGAIGSAAIQLAKHLGAEITATSRPEHIDLIKALGATTVIDYTKDDYTKSGLVFDVVIDAVGKSSYRASQKVLKAGGIYSSSELGFLWQNPFLALGTAKFGRNRVIFPIPENRREDMELFRDLIVAGDFHAVVDRTYPLDQIVEAFRYVETGQKVGNVVITIDHDPV